MRIVIALGGNALLSPGERPDLETQRQNVAGAARALVSLGRHELVLTHGNGPQVGWLAEQTRAPKDHPLDVLDALTEGSIGYLLERELRNHLPADTKLATLLTQVEVDAGDPAFGHASKPIGPRYAADEARALADERGFRLVPQGGGFRRVVPSPDPKRILALDAIALLVARGVLVICAGGGGIPVIRQGGALRGVEAVIDKDLTSALLARELGADALLMLTDVPCVYRDYGPNPTGPLRAGPPRAFASLAFEPGSMGPKVDAGCRFVEQTGGFAAIGRLEEAAAILNGEAGTRIAPEVDRLTTWGEPGAPR